MNKKTHSHTPSPSSEPIKEPNISPDESMKEESSPLSSAENPAKHTELEKKIEALEQELAKKNDECLRSYAEIQNLQKRHQVDLEKLHKYGTEKLLKDLLSVVDTLEKSLEHTKQETNTAIHEGIALTLKLLTDTLKKWGLESIEPHAQPFDPNQHEAMSMIETKDVPHGQVLNVLMRGYRLHERVLRPAMVTVAKKSDETASENSEKNEQKDNSTKT